MSSNIFRMFAFGTTLILTLGLINLSAGVFTIVRVGDEFAFGVSDIQLPFYEAIDTCGRMNMTLLSVDSQSKDRMLVDLFVNGESNVTLPGTQSWIDGHEVDREGVWASATTGHPLYYTRWFPDQPDDIENLSCAFQHTGNLLYWRDGNCSASFFFICEASGVWP